MNENIVFIVPGEKFVFTNCLCSCLTRKNINVCIQIHKTNTVDISHVHIQAFIPNCMLAHMYIA